MKIYNTIEQGTDEWFEIRKGKLTASNGTAIAANGAGLKTYCQRIIEEMITPREPFTNADIERGNELEEIAIMKYEFEHGVQVEQVGFIELNNRIGCSPDGLVGKDGGVEVKARNNAKHLALLLGNKPDTGVIWQIQMCLWITKRKWWDYLSYNPNFKNSLFVLRVLPDEKAFAKLQAGCVNGITMLEEYLVNANIKAELEL